MENKLFEAYLSTVPETEAAELLNRYNTEPIYKKYIYLVSSLDREKAALLLKFALDIGFITAEKRIEAAELTKTVDMDTYRRIKQQFEKEGVIKCQPTA